MKAVFILSLLCTQAVAQLQPNIAAKYLDKNYVRARINTDNDKFWNIYANNAMSYEVPVGKGTHAMYANSIWIGGLDMAGGLHVAANTYKQNGMDFRPGPLDTVNISAFVPNNSTPYNKLWKVDCNDINSFVTAFNNGSVSAGTYTVPGDILNYPAIGTNNFQRKMSPFMDANGNGLYDPIAEGDYPLIKGQQQILSIYNDQNGMHTETGAPPLGVEIQERSYAYFDPTLPDSMQAVNYTTFYHYTIYNRSANKYANVFLTDWSEVDIGNYSNDFIGTDSANNFAYCYNGTATDPSGFGAVGYGSKPPVMSHAILKTNCSSDGIDNNNNGSIDEAGERFILNRTTYYNNNQPAFPVQTTYPSTMIHYYNYMSGFWKDGSAFTYGGTAYGGNTPSPYVYSGDPVANLGWTETTAGNTPGDRKILLSSGPFNLLPNSRIEWGYALVFSQDTSQAVNTISQFNTRVRRDVRNALYYDETHQAPQCAPAVAVSIQEQQAKKLEAFIYPNPAKDLVNIDFTENIREANVQVIDISGRLVLSTTISRGYRGQLDLGALDNGIYLVRISSGDKTLTEKIVKN